MTGRKTKDKIKEAYSQYAEGKHHTFQEVKENIQEWIRKDSDELKTSFRNLIDEIDDDDILFTHYESLSHYRSLNKTEEITDELSTEQVKRLEKAMKQVKNGQTVTDLQMRKTIKKWLGE